jgi:hypothetical protein
MTQMLSRAYASIWAATVAGVALGLLGVRLLNAAVPYHALTESPRTALMLMAVNALVASWPLALLTLGWQRVPRLAGLADVLVRGQLLGNGLIVGNAIAQHPSLVRYLPHLPLEWAALSTPVSAWLAARAGRPWSAANTAALTLAALLAAALVETYLVPLP